MSKRIRHAGRAAAALAVAALAASPAGAGDADVVGNEQFTLNCVACHGTALEGVEGLGVSLHDSAFVGGKTVEELVTFLKVGRMPGDPGSVAGRPMPGFGWLPEADLAAIAAYVKSRHGN